MHTDITSLAVVSRNNFETTQIRAQGVHDAKVDTPVPISAAFDIPAGRVD